MKVLDFREVLECLVDEGHEQYCLRENHEEALSFSTNLANSTVPREPNKKGERGLRDAYQWSKSHSP